VATPMQFTRLLEYKSTLCCKWPRIIGLVAFCFLGFNNLSSADFTADMYAVNVAGNTTNATIGTGFSIDISIGEAIIGQTQNSDTVSIWGFLAENPQVYQSPTITPTLGPTSTPSRTPTATPFVSATPTPLPNFNGRIIDPLYFYVYPSPCRSVFVPFRFFLKQSADVKVTVYTLMGNKVWTHQGYYPQGWSEFIWNSTGVANGGYVFIAEASSGGMRETLRKKFGMVR